jgi:hypothetical protein
MHASREDIPLWMRPVVLISDQAGQVERVPRGKWGGAVRRLLAAFALLAGISQGALATPVSCDEAVSGDGSCINLIFDVGTNVVAGTMRWVWPSVDVDNPQFTIPTGMQLRSAQLEISFNDTTANNSSFSVVFDLRKTATFQFLAATCTTLIGSYDCPYGDQISSTGGALWSTVMPIPSEAYSVIPGFYSFPINPSLPSGGYFPYTFRFVVEAATVAEPTSLALLGLGLAGLAFTRRHKQ